MCTNGDRALPTGKCSPKTWQSIREQEQRTPRPCWGLRTWCPGLPRRRPGEQPGGPAAGRPGNPPTPPGDRVLHRPVPQRQPHPPGPPDERDAGAGLSWLLRLELPALSRTDLGGGAAPHRVPEAFMWSRSSGSLRGRGRLPGGQGGLPQRHVSQMRGRNPEHRLDRIKEGTAARARRWGWPTPRASEGSASTWTPWAGGI